MKKIYWIVGIILILVVLFFVAGSMNIFNRTSDNRMAIQTGDLCSQVISLNDIKGICSPSFQIFDDSNDSYFVVPNENNTQIQDNGIMSVSWFNETTHNSYSVTLYNGTQWLCEKDITNGKGTLDSNANYVSVDVWGYSSNDFADGSWQWLNSQNNNSNSTGLLTYFKAGKDFGDNSTIVHFAGGESYDKQYNQTFNTSKTTTIQFLKGDKVITITAGSPQSTNNLICDLAQMQKLAGIVDKRIN